MSRGDRTLRDSEQTATTVGLLAHPQGVRFRLMKRETADTREDQNAQSS
jgi:hypothetical protein